MSIPLTKFLSFSTLHHLSKMSDSEEASKKALAHVSLSRRHLVRRLSVPAPYLSLLLTPLSPAPLPTPRDRRRCTMRRSSRPPTPVRRPPSRCRRRPSARAPTSASRAAPARCASYWVVCVKVRERVRRPPPRRQPRPRGPASDSGGWRPLAAPGWMSPPA